MAKAARSPHPFQADADAGVPPASGWSGEVHGPVAALHQAIEAGLADGRLHAGVVELDIESPVDRLLRIGSRVTGWAVLAAAFVGTAILVIQ